MDLDNKVEDMGEATYAILLASEGGNQVGQLINKHVIVGSIVCRKSQHLGEY